MTDRRILSCLGRRLRGFAAGDSGSVTAEFMIMFPLIFGVFLSALQAGILETRYAMLDRALDMTVRELRLNQLPLTGNPTQDHKIVKQEICKFSFMISDCMHSVMLELSPVDMTTWTGLTDAPKCVDRSAKIQPAATFVQGGADQLMVIRACVLVNPILPSSTLGMALPKDSSGAYHMISTSAFVNEPT